MKILAGTRGLRLWVADGGTGSFGDFSWRLFLNRSGGSLGNSALPPGYPDTRLSVLDPHFFRSIFAFRNSDFGLGTPEALCLRDVYNVIRKYIFLRDFLIVDEAPLLYEIFKMSTKNPRFAKGFERSTKKPHFCAIFKMSILLAVEVSQLSPLPPLLPPCYQSNRPE